MPKMTMVQAINLALHEEMDRDANVLALGQDSGQNEGVFRVTAGLQKKYGADRVIDTPLAESAIMGTALGMALAGLRPVAEMQFCGFAYLAIAQLEAEVARYRSRSQGRWTAPLVLRIPYGGGVRAVEHHSESREHIFASLIGCKVVVPSGPRNARALLAAAIRDPDPVVYMEPKRSYRAIREDVPEEAEVIELGKAQIVREGSHLTVVTWGSMMPATQQAVAAVEKDRGVKIELIDLLTVSPLDGMTIAESVKKTGRCVIVQESPPSFSVASEIIARLNERVFSYLHAPVRRVTNYDVMTPYFQRELLYIPTPRRIERAMHETLDYA